MHQVFISYSTKDQPQAEAVRNVIEQNGIACWMAPRDIPGGSNYTKEIPSAIRECQAFVLMLSQNAQNSHWVLKELDNAVNEGKIILPFQLEEITLTDEFNFLLTGAQRYDAYKKKSEALQRLISRLKAIIDAGPAEAEAPQTEEVPQSNPEPKPVFAFAEKQSPMQPAAQPQTDAAEGFDTTVCPACGSMDVQRLKGKIKAHGTKEVLVSTVVKAVLALVLPVVIMFLGFILAEVLFMDFDVPWDFCNVLEDWSIYQIPLSFAGGIWLGGKLSGEWIRRQRIRSHRAVEEYRCNLCRKQFLPGEK